MTPSLCILLQEIVGKNNDKLQGRRKHAKSGGAHAFRGSLTSRKGYYVS